MKPSILSRSHRFPAVVAKSPVKGKRHPFFPSLIASHSQLEETTPAVLLNGIVQ
jgi:hypothetical protein